MEPWYFLGWGYHRKHTPANSTLLKYPIWFLGNLCRSPSSPVAGSRAAHPPRWAACVPGGPRDREGLTVSPQFCIFLQEVLKSHLPPTVTCRGLALWGPPPEPGMGPETHEPAAHTGSSRRHRVFF